jgi:rhodanese-related sulfurtransferase
MLHKSHLNILIPSRRLTRNIVKASMSEVKNITPIEAQQLKTKIIDVRTASEFSAGHAPGAVNIPFLLEIPAEGKPQVPNPEFLDSFTSQFPDKGETLVLTCHRGRRGGNAVLSLQAEGYDQLLNIGTGMGGWAEENLPLEK